MFDVKSSKVEDVLAEVESGRLGAEEALAAEKASEPVRKTLVEALEKLLEPVVGDGQPSTTAGAVTANESAEEDAKKNPNGYEQITVKTSERVNQNTGGKGSFFDPEMRQTVRAEAAEVYATPFIQALLRGQEIVRG